MTWDWNDYTGQERFSKLARQRLEKMIGFVSSTQGIADGLIGGNRGNKRGVAIPLFDERGRIVSAVVGDPALKADPPFIRLANEDVGLDPGTPVWLCSLPGAQEIEGGNFRGSLMRCVWASAGHELHLTLQPFHVLTFIQYGEDTPCIGLTGAGSLKRLVEILREQPPFKRPATVKHHFPERRHPEPLSELRELGIETDFVQSTEDADKDLTKKAVAQSSLYLLYSGKVAMWTGHRWRECAKAVAQNILVSRGWTPKQARRAVPRLPIAADWRFIPSTSERVVVSDDELWLNEFSGMPLTPRSGAWGTIHRLIYHLCGYDDEGANYFLDWLAAPLQSLYAGRGSRRNLSACVFHGVQGTGKGWLTEVLREVYGEYMLVIGQANLEDAFDPARMRSLLMLIANEVTSTTNRDDATMNRLKAWVTEDYVTIRRMQRAAEEYAVHFNMIFTSNSRRPVRLEFTDRRYSVWVQELPLPEDLVKKLRQEKQWGQWGQATHFLAHLLQRNVERRFWEPYDNRARRELIASSLDSTVVFARQLRDVGVKNMTAEWTENRLASHRRAYGGPIDPEEVEAFRVNPVDGTVFMLIRTLSEVYGIWCRQHGYRFQGAHGALKEALLGHIRGTAEDRKSVGGRFGRGLSGIPYDHTDPRSMAFTGDPTPPPDDDDLETTEAGVRG